MTPTLKDKKEAIESAVYEEYSDIDNFYNDDEPNGWTFGRIAGYANDYLQATFQGTDQQIDESDVETFWAMG